MNLNPIDEMIFRPLGLKLMHVEEDREAKEYSGCSFMVNHMNIKFRTAKITPTKTGQFVTLWKRNEKGITTPFDDSDEFDFYLIAARKEQNFGVFIFPKEVLVQKGIVSDEKKTGKRGIRVYPTWDTVESKQAIATQKWQVQYFLELSSNKEHDLQRAKLLLAL
ncbi:MepB family protein [Chryseobacterium soli]|uniref:MepB family protein n=1 Tax=Chryseobacterium soli TaxID=445961 RepID=UPI0029542F72|nr:MepB family protein [Chryseobacterium soli]MDV7696185.1 MepB family protein [Chryseobacterium soli]